jgi:hypothetical protein
LRKPVIGDKEKKAGIDVMIALDVSKSMWAEDTKPSRLDVANNLLVPCSTSWIIIVLAWFYLPEKLFYKCH